MKNTKRVLGVIGRSLLIGVAVLFILLSIGGIIGTWYVNRAVTDATLKVFSIVENGVAVADSGIDRALARVNESRSELSQTEEDIKTVGANLKENRPVLTGISDRLDARLSPAIDRIQVALEPVKTGLEGIDATLTVANSIPYFQEKAPGLQDLQDSLRNVSDLSADLQQLRTVIRSAAEGKSDALTDETTEFLLKLTERMDDRLARIQSDLEEVKDKIAELQERIAAKKNQLLFTYNLIAAVLTIMLLWVIYSQIVVIRVQVKQMRRSESITDSSRPGESPVVLDPVTVDVMASELEALPDPENQAESDSGPRPTD